MMIMIGIISKDVERLAGKAASVKNSSAKDLKHRASYWVNQANSMMFKADENSEAYKLAESFAHIMIYVHNSSSSKTVAELVSCVPTVKCWLIQLEQSLKKLTDASKENHWQLEMISDGVMVERCIITGMVRTTKLD